MKVKRYKLMIPGPVELDVEALAEMSAPLIAHYGHEWAQFYKETCELMKKIFQTQRADVYLMVGPGSAGVDAAISNLLGTDGSSLILSNGFFGERLFAIARSYTDKVKVLRFKLNEPIDPNAVEETLKKERFALVAAVHCETSTGVVNPVKELGLLCRKYNTLLVVDAISSLGGIELKFDDWHIGICVGATQKCLETPPGICPIAISPQAWDRIEKTQSPGWYLNLLTWKEFVERWGQWHPHPVTIPTGTVRALRKSVERILGEGLETRFRRHAQMASLLRQGLSNLGFELFVSDLYASPTVTTALVDERISANELIKFLKQEHGIMIAGGLDELSGKIFRIGHMGPTARLDAILPLLFGIEDALRHAGIKIEVGQSLRGLDLGEKAFAKAVSR